MDSPAGRTRLQPLIGMVTGLLIGTGVAIGSGIFRNPGQVAEHAPSPLWILAAWLFGGTYFLFSGMVVAELSTRFPNAGGEYVYLRHAYGDFVAFFFGWAYTVFIIGGGVATMAVGLGDFACEAMGWKNVSMGRWGPIDIHVGGVVAAGAIVLITGINLAGLRTGAATQSVLTVGKIVALLGVVIAAALVGRRIDWLAAQSLSTPTDGPPGANWSARLSVFAAAMMPVMWCYEGTTDSVKMTEEVRDPRRSMPRALIGTAILVTALYVLLNWAFLRVLTVREMAGSNFVAADVLGRWLGTNGRTVTLLLSMGVVLGALSSTIVSCVRVPFALGRDGMIFGFMGRMSPSQAPVGALLVSAGLAVAFSLTGVYETVLAMYTISSGVLFGLVNLSLLVFRLRERRCPAGEADHYRCPGGMVVSVLLAVVQFGIGLGVALQQTDLAKYTAGSLAAIAGIYFVWPRRR